ncbi:cupin domain-containing protein [Paenibacillus pinistramenti]|uniref:cupin domain-containing protein n=1 Tax=Paenibacillus pinistramenti TaxID=1768003 RepID=UPI0011087653|nr:cupin domain-containing protein [Paenibacillus pinistramenti]
MPDAELRKLLFKDDGVIPNNPRLPVLLYTGALESNPLGAEALFNKHNWRNSWTNGVYDYHHYHSNTHEVLGVISGEALLQLGGEQGEQLAVRAGDVIVLPAGTGHKKISASEGFRITGAYPDGMEYNLRTGKPGDRPEALEEIESVPLPDMDPVYGKHGPLTRIWALQPRSC